MNSQIIRSIAHASKVIFVPGLDPNKPPDGAGAVVDPNKPPDGAGAAAVGQGGLYVSMNIDMNI